MENNDKTVAVVGLGYVGLPLALLASEKGWNVTGIDISEEKIELINKQESPLEDEKISADLKAYPITATTSFEAAASVQVIVVAVPTPVTEDNEPDLQPLISSIESLLPHLQPGQLLSIESTINPGVMENVVIPILQKRSDIWEESTLKLHLVHCPERINPGDTKWTIRNIARVIGGLTVEAAEQGKAFYESILEADVKLMQSLTEAEAVKILENTFRDVNIAFVNEMAKSFDRLGIDIKHVIEGAATKPFSFMAHYPGNGVGGHCISVDPYYMIARAKEVGFDHEFLQLARDINNSMPEYTIQLMEHGLAKLNLKPQDVTVALLGLAYKKNIDDIRESPALEIRTLLEERGYSIRVFDPHVASQSTVQSLEEALTDVQVVMLATDHKEFTEALNPAFLKEHNIQLVIDGKNALNKDEMQKADIIYYGIGRSNITK